LEEVNNDNFDITVFPNPTLGIMSIESDFLNNKNYEVFVYTTYGKLLLKEKNSKVINLSGFSNGMYLLVVKPENVNSINRKLFLQK
jgi:hypothetical protein